MIIKDPNSNRVNQEDDNLVYLHDLTSTVFDLANQKCQKVLKGRAFFRLCVNTKITNEKVYLVSLRGILCIFEQRMWRRKDYKLVFNATDVCELYDIRNDPEEMHNLFYDSQYNSIKKRCWKKCTLR